MKQFFKQCMLFKSKDMNDVILGCVTWNLLIILFFTLIVLAHLINNLINN